MTEYEILEAMERYGGGFVVQLSRLWRHADQQNRAKLKDAFADYFTQYDEIARLDAQRVGTIAPPLASALSDTGESALSSPPPEPGAVNDHD